MNFYVEKSDRTLIKSRSCSWTILNSDQSHYGSPVKAIIMTLIYSQVTLILAISSSLQASISRTDFLISSWEAVETSYRRLCRNVMEFETILAVFSSLNIACKF